MSTQQLLASFMKVNSGPPVDDYANAVLIAHFDGANGSTTFVDSSPYNRTITSVNGAALSTSNPINGTASLLLMAADQYAAVDIPTINTGGTQKWCFEWSSNQLDVSSVFSYFTVGLSDTGGQFYANSLSGYLYVGDGVATNNIVVTLADLGIVADTTYKMALSYDGTNYRLFVNGILKQETTTKLNGSGGQLAIGARPGNNNNFSGKIDDFVVTIGSAKRTANYTPS